jgi:putative hemolysin
MVAAMAAAIIGSLFATGDAALSTLPEARLQGLANAPSPIGPAFQRYAHDRVRVLSRWLVGRVVAISAAAALIDDAVEHDSRIQGFGVLVAVLGAVVTYGTFVEILGTLARRRPEQAGALALRFLWPLEWAVVPLAEPLAALGRLIDGRFAPGRLVDARITETEVEWVVSEGERAGAIANEPAEMIRNVLDFKDLTTKDVMVPRRRVCGIEISATLDEVIQLVSTEGHSRYAVYRETLDNIVGLLYAKDLFKVMRDKRVATTKLADITRAPVLFVVETQSAGSVLREMRARSLHMAVVADEFGGTSGIVTLEDIIEEIVGEIRDEYDAESEAQVQQIGEGRFVADAAVSLSDLSSRIGHDLPADGEFESLGGLLIQRAGRVPTVGSVLSVDGVRFVVREADETHVVKVEIEAIPTTALEPA